MNMIKLKRSLALLVLIAGCCLQAPVSAQNITVQVNKPVASIQPTMWGVFFEDINMGADGGIYAELVKNRSFEFYKPLMGWRIDQRQFKEGTIIVMNRQDKNTANPR